MRPATAPAAPLTLALLSVLAALLHGGLGAVDYPLSRPAGLAMMLVAGGLLVYGILLGIRYAEAHDAMHDPLPRSALYDTAHERGSYTTGLLLPRGAAADRRDLGGAAAGRPLARSGRSAQRRGDPAAVAGSPGCQHTELNPQRTERREGLLPGAPLSLVFCLVEPSGIEPLTF